MNNIEKLKNTSLKKISKKLNNYNLVTIFGSSLRGESDKEIHYWSDITKIIADSNWGLLSGGYEGTMSYLSKKHISEGGYAIGVICSKVPDIAPDDCYNELISVATPFKRLEALLNTGSVYIVFPGGIGTLVELASAIWLQDRKLNPPKSIFLLGEDWKNWCNWFRDIPSGLRGQRDFTQMVTNIKDIDDFKNQWNAVIKSTSSEQ